MGVWREAGRYGGPFVRYDEASAVGQTDAEAS
jgi:hypothetical protein